MNLDSVTTLFAGIPTDWLILCVFAILAASETFRSGARTACVLALALPVGLVVFLAAENAAIIGSFVGQFSTATLQAVLLCILIVAAYMVVNLIGLEWGGQGGQTIQAALTGVALTAIVVTFWLATPALGEVWQFGPSGQEIFGESYRFFWLAGSYVALAFARSSS